MIKGKWLPALVLILGMAAVIAGCASTTTTNATTTTTTSTSTTTTTTLSSFIVKGIIMQNECTAGTVYPQMFRIINLEEEVLPTYEAVTFSGGVATFELTATLEGNYRVFVSDVPFGTGMISFIGAYGLTTGEGSIVQSLLFSSTEALVILSLASPEVNVGTMEMYTVF